MADNTVAPNKKQSYRGVLIAVYLVIAVGFAFYGNSHGQFQDRGFFFNFGRGLVWPFLLFPILGKIVGVIVILLIVIAVIASG